MFMLIDVSFNHPCIQTVKINFLHSRDYDKIKRAIALELEICLNPSSGTCYLCNLNKVCHAFWNSVSSSVKRWKNYSPCQHSLIRITSKSLCILHMQILFLSQYSFHYHPSLQQLPIILTCKYSTEFTLVLIYMPFYHQQCVSWTSKYIESYQTKTAYGS